MEKKETPSLVIMGKLKQTPEYRELLETLSLLVGNIRSVGSCREILKPCAAEMIARSERLQQLAVILKPGLLQQTTEKSDTLQKALYYLGFFEVMVSGNVDRILMIFIANHHDPYLRGRYARNLHDLEKAYLSEKLKFLNCHHIAFLQKHLNWDLRNKIAHMDFEPQPNGIIVVDHKEYKLKSEIAKLTTLMMLLGDAITQSGFPAVLKDLQIDERGEPHSNLHEE